MAKRVTVSITLGDYYWYCSQDDMRRIKHAMIQAGVSKAIERGVSIEQIDSKCAVNARRK